MCPDYNKLPKGYLQRAPEGMKRERKTTVALHVVITSWGSMVPILFLWRVGLKDSSHNNSASPVSAVGGASSHWSLTGGACHPELSNPPSSTHKLLHYVY